MENNASSDSKQAAVSKPPKFSAIASLGLSCLFLKFFFVPVIVPIIATLLALHSLKKNHDLEQTVKWIDAVSILAILLSFIPTSKSIYYTFHSSMLYFNFSLLIESGLLIQRLSLILGAGLLMLLVIILLLLIFQIKIINRKGEEMTYRQRIIATTIAVVLYYASHIIISLIIMSHHVEFD